MSRPTIARRSDFPCLVVEQALTRSAPPGQTLDFCDASFSTRAASSPRHLAAALHSRSTRGKKTGA
jgi:hypothetical protein